MRGRSASRADSLQYPPAVQIRALALSLTLLAGCGNEYEGTLGEARFTLQLPSGSRVVREETSPDLQYRRWEPESGDGLVVEVRVYENADPCRGPEASAGRAGETVAGVYRPTSFSFDHCLGDGAHHIRCACWHTRRHLRPDEVAPARETCASFRVLP